MTHPSKSLDFPFYKARCPHCLAASVFELWKHEYRNLIFQDVEYCIRCTKCAFELNVPKKHYSMYQELGTKYAELVANSISQDDFAGVLRNMDLPELDELRLESETWPCQCGEENPTNFASCWKCGGEATVDVRPSAEKEIRLSERFPWE